MGFCLSHFMVSQAGRRRDKWNRALRVEYKSEQISFRRYWNEMDWVETIEIGLGNSWLWDRAPRGGSVGRYWGQLFHGFMYVKTFEAPRTKGPQPVSRTWYQSYEQIFLPNPPLVLIIVAPGRIMIRDIRFLNGMKKSEGTFKRYSSCSEKSRWKVCNGRVSHRFGA